MKTLSAVITSCVFLSCTYTRGIHSPKPFIAPLFTESNQLHTDASFSLGTAYSLSENSKDSLGFAPGYQVSAAYNPFNHFYVFGSYSYGREFDYLDSNRLRLPLNATFFYDHAKVNYARNNSEIGVGYYRSVLNKREALTLIVNGNTSIGFGSLRFTDNFSYNNINFKRNWSANVIQWNTMLVLQGALDRIQGAVCFKLVRNFYKGVATDYKQSEKTALMLENLNNRTFIEVGYQVGYTFKRIPVKLQSQLSFALDEFTSSRNLMLSVGGGYVFNLRRRKG